MGIFPFFVMKKLTLSLALLLSTLSASATGWVYMGLYPYMYDGNTARWSYSSTPVLWHVDMYTSQWYSMGVQPPNYAPDFMPGIVVELTLSNQSIVDFYCYLSNEAVLDDLGVVGTSNYVYYYEDLGNNKAILAAKDEEILQDEAITLALVFSNYGKGYFSGVIMNGSNVVGVNGTFAMFLW